LPRAKIRNDIKGLGRSFGWEIANGKTLCLTPESRGAADFIFS
jgi:hypothetical protein